MTRKIKTCACGSRSVPGLIPGVALCQKHFDALFYKTGPEHAEAVRMFYAKRKPTCPSTLTPAD